MSTPHTPSSSSPRPRAWEKLDTRHSAHMILFRPRWDRLRHPRSGEEFERLVLETPDWVNVVALTTDKKLVCVHQYRFGTSSVTLEIPGGVLDKGEHHAEAAKRELQEETGYTSARWTYLGAVEPNPAFHDNLCHHWLAEDCKLTHAQGLDPGEDIEIEAVDLADVHLRIARGEMRHSLVISALSRVLDLRPR
ncbi:MAG: NUDIX hydrolase [Planctomycetes bacterium]|nr:NUDIX hydrolase [Planctomycetota bacterium]